MACTVVFCIVSTVAWAFCFSDCHAFDADLKAWAEEGGAYGKPEYSPPGIQYEVVLPDTPSDCVISDLGDLTNISGEPGEDLHAVRAGSQDICKGKVDEVLNLPELKAFKGFADQEGYLVLRLRSFPAWSVQVNGRVMNTTMERGHGLIAVPVTPGPVDVVVRWATTPDVIAGRSMSALAFAMMVGLYFWERRLVVESKAAARMGNPR